MQQETVPRASPREAGPGPGLLLPKPLRRLATALVAACVVLTVGLVVYLAGLDHSSSWLNTTLDPRILGVMSRFPALVWRLPEVGTFGPVTLMTLALIAGCLATRRRSAALLAAVAVPAAIILTEYVLKPYVGGAIGQGFPSGHATSMFALAAICAVLLADPPRRPLARAAMSLLLLSALVLAVAVSAAMVAIGAHKFTDVVAGAAVGTGVVLACALAFDLAAGRARRARAERSGSDG
jgi:membrane-associated phospholipid phosphatase